MPLVDYQDEKTGEIEEVLIRTSNIPETIISEKTGNICKRIISGSSSFVFKGTGFYATDYKQVDKI